MNAIEAAIDEPERALRSLSIQYPRPPAEGPAEVEVRVERAGRSVTNLSVRLIQEGQTMALALAICSLPWAGPEFSELQMPVPKGPPAERRELPAAAGLPQFMGNIEMRYAVGEKIFVSAEQAYTGGWMRLRPPRTVDAATAAFFADVWWPPVFSRLDGRCPPPPSS